MLYFHELPAAFDLPGNELTPRPAGIRPGHGTLQAARSQAEPRWHEVLAVLQALAIRRALPLRPTA